MTPTLMAVIGYALWTLLLGMAIAITRVAYVIKGAKAANEFAPSGEDIGGFVVRLTRAHANCYENLPAFLAVCFAAVASGNGAISDSLAMWVLYARVAQSVVHIVTTSPPAVNLRFVFWGAQIVLIVVIAIRIGYRLF